MAADEVARLEQRVASLRLGIVETACNLVAIEDLAELDVEGLLRERNLRGTLRRLAILYGEAEEQLRRAQHAASEAAAR